MNPLLLSFSCKKCGAEHKRFRNILKGHGKALCLACENASKKPFRTLYADLSPEERLKARVRSRTKMQIRRGKLVRKPCEVCGDSKSQAHHDDYSKPDDIRWLCHMHHLEVHGVISNALILWKALQIVQQRQNAEVA